MYSTAKGTKTSRVITSCMILSWPRLSAVAPMRLAGTCSRYSNNAIDQLTRAATYHALPCMLQRWPYHAKVMKTFDPTRSSAACIQAGAVTSDAVADCSQTGMDVLRGCVGCSVAVCCRVASEADDELVAEACEQGEHPAVAGDLGFGGDLGQRLQHEGTLMHARMRHHQARLVDDRLAMQQQVEIHGTRRQVPGPRAPTFMLDRQQGVEQRARRQGGVHRDHCVDVVRVVVGHAHRRGVVERGARCDLRGGQGGDALERQLEGLRGVAEVRTEGDVGADSRHAAHAA